MRPIAALAAMGLILAMSGCRVGDVSAPTEQGASNVTTDNLAPGVVHRSILLTDGTQVELVDEDLSAAQYVPRVVASNIQMAGGHVAASALTPAEWQMEMHALAVVNGGYFGQEHDDGAKDIVGLLVQSGHVRHVAPPVRGSGSVEAAPGLYVRSAFGVMPDGAPSIAWAGTMRGGQGHLFSFAHPAGADLRPAAVWPVWEAIGCGPMLFHRGKRVLTDREERLVSPEERPRTFVAYDVLNGHPAHFVMGTASMLTYPELADVLTRYYDSYYGTQPYSAMCVDGGSSTQLTYLGQDGAHSPMDTGVTVPDCIMLLHR